MDKSVKKSIKLYLDGQQVSGSVNAIKAEVRKLTKEMNKLTIGTDEYEKKAKEISNLKGILQAHRKEISQANTTFMSAKEKIAHYGNKVKEVGMSIFGFSQGIKGLSSLFSSLPGPIGKAAAALTQFVEAGVLIASNHRGYKTGKNFVVGLAIRPLVQGRVLEVNSIRNVFPKDNAEWLNWISQDKLLYVNKGKIQTLIDQQRTILADVGYLNLDDVANKIKIFQNPKFSEGNLSESTEKSENSPKFFRWFNCFKSSGV